MKAALALSLSLLAAPFVPLAVAQAQGGAAVGPLTSTATRPATTPAATPNQQQAPQATTSSAAAANPTTSPAAQQSSPSTTDTATLSPTLTFRPLSTMVACQLNSVQWLLSGVDSRQFELDIYAFNIGVPQDAPAAASPSASPASSTTQASPQQTPASSQKPPSPSGTLGQTATPNAIASPVTGRAWPNLAARADGQYNVTVREGWNASIGTSWKPNVPPGQYRLGARVNDKFGTSALSDVFTVVAGTNTSCILTDPSATSDQTVPASTTGSAGSSPHPASITSTAAGGDTNSEGQGTASKKSGISGGAIAGIVVGVIAGLALLALVLFFCMRRKRSDSSGGRKEIGAPSNFRKVRRGNGSTNSKFGLALSGLGMGSGGNSNNHSTRNARSSSGDDSFGTYDTEKAVPLTPARPEPLRSQSAMSRESENPFQTAPSTPIEEHNMADAMGAGVLGGASAASAAAAAAAAHTPSPSRGFRASQHGAMSSESDTDPYYSPAARQHRYSDAYGGETPSHVSPRASGGPQLMPSLPATPATPYSSESQPTRLPYAAPAHSPSGPQRLPPAFTPGHHSERSTSSTVDGLLADAHAVPGSSPPRDAPAQGSSSGAPLPPSSFNHTQPSSPRGPERKTSLRRKPVPKLYGEDGATSDGVTSRDSSDQSQSHGTSPGAKPTTPPAASGIGSGPPGDQFGLGAALAGVGFDHGLSFQLMPDPPLEQRDR